MNGPTVVEVSRTVTPAKPWQPRIPEEALLGKTVFWPYNGPGGWQWGYIYRGTVVGKSSQVPQYYDMKDMGLSRDGGET